MNDVSVILTTHNQPQALQLALAGYARQRAADFDLFIADDGSRPDTQAVIEAAAQTFSRPLTHIWKAHSGRVGKCAMQNKAIALARSGYLIFTDGDMVPREDFVATHLAWRKPGYFLAGGDYRLLEQPTQALKPDDVASGRAFDAAFLHTLGQHRTRRDIKLARSWINPWLDRLNFSTARWSGNNASAWRDALLKVDGFDEELEWREDTDLGARLHNAGVKSRHVRHNAIALHLWHPTRWNKAHADTGYQAWQDTLKSGRTTPAKGLSANRDRFTVTGYNGLLL